MNESLKYDEELKEARLFRRRLQNRIRKGAKSKFRREKNTDIKVSVKSRSGILNRISISVPKHILVHQYGIKEKTIKERVKPFERIRKGRKENVKGFTRIRNNVKLKSTPIISNALNENNELENFAHRIGEIRADNVVAKLNYKL